MDAGNPSDEGCGRRAGSCCPTGSRTVCADGTAGGKPAPTAIHAAGLWNSSAHRRTGAYAQTQSPNVRGCSPSGSRGAGSTSRRKEPATI